MDAKDQIFAGNFLITTDVYLLQVARDSPLSGEFQGFVDVDPVASLAVRLDNSFDRADVSVLGHVGRRNRGGVRRDTVTSYQEYGIAIRYRSSSIRDLNVGRLGFRRGELAAS